jgi:hypothetical protein
VSNVQVVLNVTSLVVGSEWGLLVINHEDFCVSWVDSDGGQELLQVLIVNVIEEMNNESSWDSVVKSV